MKAEIIKQASPEGIPAVSGIEVIEGMIYLLDANDPFLYYLDPYLNLKSKIELNNEKPRIDNRYNESFNLDVKAMTSFKINNYPHLLILGSGSRPSQNDIAYLIKLPTPFNRKHLVWEKDMSELYNLFRVNDEVDKEGQLNIEEAATGVDFIVFYNRISRANRNSALYFSLEEFIEFIQGHTESVPFPLVQSYELPKSEKIPGISSATIFDHKLFFTGCINNEFDYERSKSIGNLIGWKEVQSFKQIRGMESEPIGQISNTSPLQENGDLFHGKVRAISITEKVSDKHYTALAIQEKNDKLLHLLLVDVFI